MSRRRNTHLGTVTSGAAVVALLLGSCTAGASAGSSSRTGGGGSTTSATTAAPPPTSATTSAGPTQSATAAPGGTLTLDPCSIVPASEASALVGTHFGTGTLQRTSSSSKACVYRSGLTVLDVVVVRAANAAAARAAFDSERARAQDFLSKSLPASIKISFSPKSIPGLGDRAAVGTGSAQLAGTSIKGSAIYVLKDATFFSISDVSATRGAASVAALKAEATKVLGRL